MSATEYLDQLDALHAAATDGPWKRHPADGEYVIGAWVSDDEYLDVADTFGFRENRGNSDAALIVAAVNALPQLTAAVRAVLKLHVPLDRGTGPNCQGCATHVTFTPWPCATVEAITAALNPAAPQSAAQP